MDPLRPRCGIRTFRYPVTLQRVSQAAEHRCEMPRMWDGT